MAVSLPPAPRTRSFIAALGLTLSVGVFAQTALAAAPYPSRPVMVIVASQPGGSIDYLARLLSEPLSKALGQPVLVENKPGASGNIGNQYVAAAPPDGYTLLLSYNGFHVGNPHLFKNAGWDPIKDFAPIGMVARSPQVFVVNAKLPVNSIKELIDYARAHPGKLDYASSGNGSVPHVAGELFKQITGTKIEHIPYKGAGGAVQDLAAGQVDMYITSAAGVMPQIKAGRIKALTVTGDTRLTSLPDVPTAKEAGLQGFELDSWFALYAPKGTPDPIVQRLHTELDKLLSDPALIKQAEGQGMTFEKMSSTDLAAYTRQQLDYWGKVIADAKLTMD